MALVQFASVLMVALAMVSGRSVPTDKGQMVSSFVAESPTSVIEYWTEERIASAIPPHSDQMPNELRSTKFAGGSNTNKYVPKGDQDYVERNVGKLYFVDTNGKDRICTASVVQTKDKNHIITAGHCAYTLYPKRGYHRNLLFIVRENGTQLLFVIKSIQIHQTYQSRTPAYLDVALLGVNQFNGQDVAKHNSPTIRFNAIRPRQTSYFGFPTILNEVDEPVGHLYTSSGANSLWFDENTNDDIPYAHIDSSFYSAGGPIYQNFNGQSRAQLVAITTIKEVHHGSRANGPLFTGIIKELVDFVNNL